ncbi:MAG: anhydro-N-acetylmuramic acid kinase [Xanthomonadales bacterium]|nr:anhydro-N-acetylmuramic acid kinase [Xanthomonadales bacterium]
MFIGLISGTSRDGVDAALVSLEDGRTNLLHAQCRPYPPALRADLDRMIQAGEQPAPGKAAALDEQLGRFFARTALELLEQAGVEQRDVAGIGSHGQTVWHEPDAERPISIQLGSGSMIARSTGITTVTDFRRADLRAGGQGAPLAPLLHREVFASGQERRAVLNLGGIANLTLLDPDGPVRGFDTGPGNCLLDAWIEKCRGLEYDEHGAWAASGTCAIDLLDVLAADPWFQRPPPKSTGLEYFNLRWLLPRLADRDLGTADVQNTLAELTAATIARALEDFEPQRLLVCGGGVHNAYLMARLKERVGDCAVESTALHGMDPDWVEAVLFAWLAAERLAERPQDTGPITGARQPVLLGKVYAGKERG